LSKAEHNQRRRKCAGEGGGHREGSDSRGKRGERTDRRAAGDAEHVGIRERIAQEHLEERAGNGKQTADRERGERAWQSQLAHDRRAGRRIAREGAHDCRTVDTDASSSERKRECCNCCESERSGTTPRGRREAVMCPSVGTLQIDAAGCVVDYRRLAGHDSAADCVHAGFGLPRL
jgi:hypothetical protein